MALCSNDQTKQKITSIYLSSLPEYSQFYSRDGTSWMRVDGKTCQQPQVVRVYNIIIGHIEYIFDMFSQITYMAEN